MNRSEILTFLRTVEPFSALTSEAQSLLADGCVLRTFAAKDLIFLEQSDGDLGYAIVSGRVALVKTSPSGKELIVELLGTRELFGIVVVLDSATYPLTARAQCPTVTLGFRRSLIQSVMKSYPELQLGFTNLLRNRLQTSHNLARTLAHDRVDVRVASVLSALSTKTGESSVLEIGRQELADVCGITIETASRVMKGFEKEGAVDLSEVGTVRLLDKAFLQRTIEAGGI